MSSDQKPLPIGIVSVSDRASRGVYEDRSGPAITAYLDSTFRSPIEIETRLVADEQDDIQHAICDLVDDHGCALILTSGGTGPAVRDVTPEAVIAITERQLPGFGERMRATSWDRIPTAILSRQLAAIRGRSLIVTLPGNPRAVSECLDAVFGAIPHCLELLGWPKSDTENRPIDRH